MSYEYESLIAGAVIEDVALSKRMKFSMLMELNEVYWKAELFNELKEIILSAEDSSSKYIEAEDYFDAFGDGHFTGTYFNQEEFMNDLKEIIEKYESEAE